MKHKLSSPEQQLILAASCTQLTAEKRVKIEELLTTSSAKINWKLLIQLARKEQVLTLVYQNLLENYPQYIPENITIQLKQYSQMRTVWNLQATKQMCDLMTLFQAEGIKVIPFKGAVLASTVYENLALREFCDLDLLIDEQDYLQVKNILTSQGYEADIFGASGVTFNIKNSHRNDQDQKPSLLTPIVAQIDVHWQIADSCFPYRVNFPQLWADSTTLSILKQQIQTLSPEDTLIFLCVQLTKDCYSRREKLIKICDIAELISHLTINWQTVHKKANQIGFARLLYFGLGMTQKFYPLSLDAAISEQIEKQIKTDWILNLYINYINFNTDIMNIINLTSDQKGNILNRRGLFELGIVQGIYGLVLFVLLLFRKPWLTSKHNYQLILHCLNYAFRPNEQDKKMISLPTKLEFLYYLIRPFRIINKIMMIDNYKNPI